MPDLHVKAIRQPVTLPRELAIDWGLIHPDTPPEPTPTEQALAILEPELRRCPQYDAAPTVPGPGHS